MYKIAGIPNVVSTPTPQKCVKNYIEGRSKVSHCLLCTFISMGNLRFLTRRSFDDDYYNILHPNRRHKGDIFYKRVGVYYFYQLTTDEFLYYHFFLVYFSFFLNQRGSFIRVLVVRHEHESLSESEIQYLWLAR